MNKPAIAIVSGTRPEIIKLAPVYHALKQARWADVEWIHTGQHAQMGDEILECFDIVPGIAFERRGTSLQEFSAYCRARLDAAMDSRPWSMCIVQGDTESAFLGALAAFYKGIPVAHVEAGLRTYNLSRPFPEEGLRQMISRITQFHFAPTQSAYAALTSEGIAADKILLTGNTVVDAQRLVREKHGIARKAEGRGHILVTVHRREHWGAQIEDIFHAVADIAKEHPATPVLFPVHLNPIVKEAAHAILGGLPNVRLTAPLGYLEMQQALADAMLLLTDSGGLQEEAPTFGVPVLVLRTETERPEAVQAGCAVIVGPERLAIVNEVRRLMNDELAYRRMQKPVNPYGDGHASRRIDDCLATHLLGLARQATAA